MDGWLYRKTNINRVSFINFIVMQLIALLSTRIAKSESDRISTSLSHSLSAIAFYALPFFQPLDRPLSISPPLSAPSLHLSLSLFLYRLFSHILQHYVTSIFHQITNFRHWIFIAQSLRIDRLFGPNFTSANQFTWMNIIQPAQWAAGVEKCKRIALRFP